MIEVKNLVKRYGKHAAVDHVSFTVKDGQIYGFLGPNGAGKTTTMNMMTGYLGITEGEILINGHDILKEPEEAKRCIGYLPELPPLYTDMTVKEYLSFAADLKQIRKEKKDEAVRKAMGLTGLFEAEERLIRNLSKGFKQRVGLAQAVLGFPEIIILDEPMVGLDPKQILEIREMIRQLAKEHTVIISSHILSEISAICDQILIISRGRLVASGTPGELETLLSGTGRLALSVKADEETIHKVLLTLPEIKDYDLSPSAEEGVWDIETEAGTEAGLREKLFFAFAAEEKPILMMKVTGATLEDVFLELTADETPAPEPAEPESGTEAGQEREEGEVNGNDGHF